MQLYGTVRDNFALEETQMTAKGELGYIYLLNKIYTLCLHAIQLFTLLLNIYLYIYSGLRPSPFVATPNREISVNWVHCCCSRHCYIYLYPGLWPSLSVAAAG